MSDFASVEVLLGKLIALVKNIMKKLGVCDPNKAVRLSIPASGCAADSSIIGAKRTA